VGSKIVFAFAAALWAIFIGLWASPLHAQSSTSRIEQMLKQDDFTFRTHNATTWSIELERKNLGKVRVILSTGSDILVTFAILAKKANINKTLKLMDTLLSANHEYDYVKVGLDKDGDMFVRIDTPLRTLDAPELKAVVNQVANASDEVFAKVSGFVKH
jgi:hypothetical protein